MSCCHKSIKELELLNGSNSGLLLSRYLKEQKEKEKDKGKKEKDKDNGEKARIELFSAVINAAKKSYDIYKTAYKSRKKYICGSSADFILNGRMIIGLGATNVLENGLTLNHIYGAPIITGSALKGLASHYCSSVLGESDPNFKGPERDENNGGIILTKAGEYYEFIFGKVCAKSDSDNEKEKAGFITFHDAWIKPESLSDSLHFDVMTTHHQDYYDGKAAPTDFDSPNPISFLSVSGKFEIIVSCKGRKEDDEKRKSWEKLTLDILKRAFSEFGIGGKTNSGYGVGELKT